MQLSIVISFGVFFTCMYMFTGIDGKPFGFGLYDYCGDDEENEDSYEDGSFEESEEASMSETEIGTDTESPKRGIQMKKVDDSTLSEPNAVKEPNAAVESEAQQS